MNERNIRNINYVAGGVFFKEIDFGCFVLMGFSFFYPVK